MTSRAPRRRRDAGFTLPEMLISIVILATISTVLVGVFSVVLRNTPTTEARAQDARSVMGLVTWLPQDVDSTPPQGFDKDPATPSGCGSSPGTNLLRLQWSEWTGGATTTYIANYRHVPDGAGARVQRITCQAVGSGPFVGGVAQTLTSLLPPLPAGWTPGNAPASVTIDTDSVTGDVQFVTFELTTFDGDIVKTDSAPKNPSDTLPTTTLPSWMPPTPSTIANVNHQPTTVNLALTAHPDPAVTAVNLIVDDVDGDTLVVELGAWPMGWTVSLSSLQMNIIPAASDVGTTQTITYTVDDQRGDGIVTGSVTIDVVPTSTPTTTSTTTTTTTTTLPVCAVVGASLSPSSVKNVQPDSQNQGGGNVNVGVLRDSVTISATTNAYCTGLEVRYESGGVNTPPFIGMTQTGPNSWSLVLPGRDDGSSETWSDGAHAISFYSATGGPWGTVNLTVT